MRWFINYLRNCFCKHEFEKIGLVNIYDGPDSTRPFKTRETYMCKKCGYIKRVRL